MILITFWWLKDHNTFACPISTFTYGTQPEKINSAVKIHVPIAIWGKNSFPLEFMGTFYLVFWFLGIKVILWCWGLNWEGQKVYQVVWGSWNQQRQNLNQTEHNLGRSPSCKVSSSSSIFWTCNIILLKVVSTERHNLQTVLNSFLCI